MLGMLAATVGLETGTRYLREGGWRGGHRAAYGVTVPVVLLLLLRGVVHGLDWVGLGGGAPDVV